MSSFAGRIVKMNKKEFLSKLKRNLYDLPRSEIQERLNFYSEMIDDLVEEGLTEEQAVLKIGDTNEIAKQIISDAPFNDVVEETLNPQKKIKGWQLALLIIGSPLWFSLLVVGVAVVFSLFVSLFAVLVSLWAVFISLIACSIASVIVFIIYLFIGNALTGFAVLGAGFVCAGLSIFSFYFCKAFTKLNVSLSKKLLVHVKTQFSKRRKA